jgi:glycosyltransferase involved in cell wall biosynthesis
VHGFNMMRALGRLGHAVGVATFRPMVAGALQDFVPDWQGVVEAREGASADVAYAGLQERFRSYWGADVGKVAAVRKLARTFRADAVIAAGMDALPYFPALGDRIRVWYAADDLVRQYLMWVRPGKPSTWVHLKQAALMVAYERAFAPAIDRAWAVSDVEAGALRRYGGLKTIDVLPNGVDAEHFTRTTQDDIPDSVVFWGRLDFEPNIQAVDWFARNVWPGLRAARPGALATFVGFNPAPAVKALRALPGVDVLADLPDIRQEVSRRSVVVLPFLSGGGIKNKLLEAAALSCAVVCSDRTVEGLDCSVELPFLVAGRPSEWHTAILGLWSQDDTRRQLGARARQWVVDHHSWEGVARRAADAIRTSLANRA